ncbi:hypothetical protein RRG08_025832 [Elysia crispata]|uniref:Dermatopontin n=1 Tax=Elysia crispata TaxID=231223 RepID=A0AAE0Y4H6_9GAST|nr:hypothetical protein RRG08_025832 [Elysia crispata]
MTQEMWKPSTLLAVALVLIVFLNPAEAEHDLVNNWQSSFTFECPSAQVLASFYSVYSNTYVDRRWKFTCKSAPEGAFPITCQWSDVTVFQNMVMSHTCPDNYVLAGLQSKYDTQRDTRSMKFKCCTDPAYRTSSCYLPPYGNQWEETLDYQVPARMVAAGTFSLHSDQLQDRRYGFFICSYGRSESPRQ